MTGNVMHFRGPIRQKLPDAKLFRPDRMAEAVADALERAAPHGRCNYTKRRFKTLSTDDARRAVEGRASKAILDKMFKEGGWGFVLEVFALFFDRGVDQYLAQEAHRHAENAERLLALTRSFGPRPDPGLRDPDSGARRPRRVAGATGGDLGEARVQPRGLGND